MMIMIMVMMMTMIAVMMKPVLTSQELVFWVLQTHSVPTWIIVASVGFDQRNRIVSITLYLGLMKAS